jgi:hypothetical protein
MGAKVKLYSAIAISFWRRWWFRKVPYPIRVALRSRTNRLIILASIASVLASTLVLRQVSPPPASARTERTRAARCGPLTTGDRYGRPHSSCVA